MKKKLFTFFLALVASAGIASAAITVRLDPSSCSSWSTVRLWAWTDSGNIFDSWPGQIVSTDDDGWYSYTFDEDITSVSIIWNNGGTYQTVDIEGVTSSTCYALNSTSGKAITISVVNCSSGSSQGGTPVSGKYKIDDLYYNLDATNQTAEVTYQLSWSENNYSGLTAATIPASVTYNSVSYSVTSIGESAFRDCSSLTSVTIPNSVTSIGNLAFDGCTSLTSVTIPNSVTNIGEWAFRYCSSLTSINVVTDNPNYCSVEGVLFNKDKTVLVQCPGGKEGDYTIPNSVTSIGSAAFAGCSSLTSVTIPNSVTSIGDGAFAGCSSLTSVTIPNIVTSIGDYTFYDCSGLTSVTIPNSVTSIGEEAFYKCSGLTSVTIGNSVTSIGEEAFYYCTGLTSVTISNSVTSIGERAFYGCSSLTSVTIPNIVTSIGEWAFSGCKIDKIYFSGTMEEWCIKSFNPNKISFAYTLYINGEAVSNAVIPNSVTSIGGYAFSDCTGLTSVTIPNSVTSIGDYTFYDCSGLTSVTIEAETPPTLGNSVFTSTNNCPIYVPCGTLDAYKTAWSAYASRIKYAPYSSYNINKKAENGHITTSSTDIFTMCDTEHPVICTATPDRGCYFVRWADGNTENPRTIELSQDTTMEAIFDYLLSGKCGKDSALTWTFEPASMALNITGKGALSENYTYGTFIESLAIGNEITTIGEKAFRDCSGLTSVTIGNSVTSIGGQAFEYCTSLTSVTIPNSVTSIGESAFEDCSSLTSVTIGNSVTSIGEGAFYYCTGLKNVILGSSVKVLEKEAFAYCSSIETITCYSMRPPTANQDALYDLDYSTIVYVPADYLETYKMHDAWGLYDVRPLGAKTIETTDVNVTPAETTAEVAWPAVSGAATYELVIKDKSGNVICTLIFNAQGQLTQIAFNAPARNNAPQQTQAAGFSFTVTGLEEGTSYDLTITSKDNNGGTLDTKTVSFTTTGEPQGIEDVQGNNVQCTKVVRDGQIFILRGEKVYSLTGQEVR